MGQKENIDINKIQWDSIKTILGECLYGGKVDNLYDKRILQTLIDHLFNVGSYDGQILFENSE